MAPDEPRGREMPLLVILLVASFVIMILSGVMFVAKLPEPLARALFLSSVIIWFAIGIWVVIDGQREVARISREQRRTSGEAAHVETESPSGPKDG